MKHWCTKCGSPNHQTMDCSLPDGTVFVPPPSELEEFKKQEAEKQAVVIAKANEPKLDPPRWPNGPYICTKENLPAFKDKGDLNKFKEANAPGHGIRKAPWLCDHCSHWHVVGQPPGPSGGSSGTQREDNIPKGFKPFLRQSTKDATRRVELAKATTEMDFPEQEVKPEQVATKTTVQAAAKSTVPRAPVKKIKTTEDGQAGLF